MLSAMDTVWPLSQLYHQAALLVSALFIKCNKGSEEKEAAILNYLQSKVSSSVHKEVFRKQQGQPILSTTQLVIWHLCIIFNVNTFLDRGRGVYSMHIRDSPQSNLRLQKMTLGKITKQFFI